LTDSYEESAISSATLAAAEELVIFF